MKKNQKDSNDFGHRKLTLKVRFRHFLATPVNICESQIKKLFFLLLIFFAKIKPLLTHVRKTPPLRSHYLFYNIVAFLKEKWCFLVT